MPLEEKLEYREFSAPFFTLNDSGYTKYRAYLPTVKINCANFELELPSRLEFLTEGNNWQRLPVVFPWFSYLVIFTTNDHYKSNLNCEWKPSLGEFYEEAGKNGLTPHSY